MVGSVQHAFIERDTFSEARDVRRRVDVERRERPLLTASTNTDLEPSAAELIERAQALREMHGAVKRRDIHRATEPDALSTRGRKSQRLCRPELRKSAEHLLLGPHALETERLGTAEERAKRLRVKRAVGKTLRHRDRSAHAKDTRSGPLATAVASHLPVSTKLRTVGRVHSTSRDQILALGAARLSEAVHAREISCREVMVAHLDRISERNPSLNTIVSLRDGDALVAEAGRCDDELAAGMSRGWMHGMPQAIKDLAPTAGLRTTFGSRLTEHFVPTADALIVERMRAAGCIIIGKTNVPEHGLGSHTFNDVYGTTLNPYDTTRTAGGSSGGAAVALATRMLPVADGSDYMGSLRNPAAWNDVFGFRPSQGRVPSIPERDAYLAQLGTEGPMGRSVVDLALLLGTQAGEDQRAPLSLSGRLDELSTVESDTGDAR